MCSSDLLEHIAVAVGGRLHLALAILGVGIGKVLLPGEAEPHRERMGDRHPPFEGIGGEIGIMREEIEKARRHRRHQTPFAGDAIEEADDALGDRAHVMDEVRAVAAAGQGLAPAFVIALGIVLEGEAPAAQDEQPMDAFDGTGGDLLPKARAEIGPEPGRCGSHRRPVVGGGRSCNDSNGLVCEFSIGIASAVRLARSLASCY